jgi:hypothetical protein
LFPTIFAFLLGFCLSAFYFIPTLLEMNFTNVISQVGGGADFKDHFICLSQLWTSQWGFGGSTKGCVDGLSFMGGKYHILLSVFAILLLALRKYIVPKSIFNSKDENVFQVIYIFAFFLLLSIFLMLEPSSFLWKLLKPMEFIQYPWRFLMIAVFTMSLVSGAVLWMAEKLIKGRMFYVTFVIMCFGIVLLNYKFFLPQIVEPKTQNDYITKERVNWNISNISSEYMPQKFLKPKKITEIANFNSLSSNDVRLVSYSKKANLISVNLEVNKPTVVILPIAYFPAWSITINGQKTTLIEDKRGIKVTLGSGTQKIELKFVETLVERVSEAISISGLLGLFIGIIYFRKKYDKI